MNQTDRSSIAGRLTEALNVLDLTQISVAQKVMVSQPYLSQLMNGKRDLPFKVLQKIAKNYPINPSWVLTGEGEMLKNDGGFVAESLAIYKKPSDAFDLLRAELSGYAARISKLEEEVNELRKRIDGEK